MNVKKILAIALAVSIPFQGAGYVAYAQSATQVDPEFMSKLEAAPSSVPNSFSWQRNAPSSVLRHSSRPR